MAAESTQPLTDLQVGRLVLLLASTPVEDAGRYAVVVGGDIIASHDDVAVALRQADVHGAELLDQRTGQRFPRRQVKRFQIASDALQLAGSLRRAA